MSDNNSEELGKTYESDPRTTCKYGDECYQKNPQHRKKYKHPPQLQSAEMDERDTKKRKLEDGNVQSSAILRLQKYRYAAKDNPHRHVDKQTESSSSITVSDDSSHNNNKPERTAKESSSSDDKPSIKDDFENQVTSSEKNIQTPKASGDSLNVKKIILELFLVEMPEDFYKFYEFCCTLSSENPCRCLKAVDLELVGPYDVINGKIKEIPSDNNDKFLRHWRYFYDPPEFQTILKGNNQEGLHYGYWRDDPAVNPTFVAKNYANKDCKIISVAPNIFGAVQIHIEERLKTANPFEKNKIARLLRDIKSFAKDHNINLENTSTEMRSRGKKLVTKTFHGAGIVVPFDKNTQLGYRSLAITDSHFLKLLKDIENAESDEDRDKHLSKLQEVIRLATIAADECDFGTPLELGHDLFSSGIEYVQKTSLRMLAMSYGLLKRPQFLKIAEAHQANRTKGCDLSVI